MTELNELALHGLLKVNGVPEELITANMAYLEPATREALSVILDEMFRLTYNGIFGRSGIFLTGPAGRGKSYTAVALAKEIVLRRVDTYGYDQRQIPYFTSMIGLLNRIKDSYSQGTTKNDATIAAYATTHCLVLDDIGVEKATDWVMEQVYTLINDRYLNRKHCMTIITSNLPLENIADKFGERIASRIAGMCNVVELGGHDRRWNQ